MGSETSGQFADADPEYALDGADDIDLEVHELVPTDPSEMPKDQGDIGSAERGGDPV